MADLTYDIIEGSSAGMDRNGYRVTDVYRIRNMTRSSTLLYDAMKLMGIRYYDAYRGDTSLRVVDVEAKPLPKCRDGCVLTVTYRQDDCDAIMFDGSVMEVPTNFDVDNKLILVDYKPTAAGGTKITSVGQAVGAKAIGELVYMMTLDRDPEQYLTYLNTINSGAFRGGDKFTWWCYSMAIEKRKSQKRYGFRVAFRYDEQTWIKPCVYRNGNDIIPTDIDDFVPKVTKQGDKNGYTNPKIRGESDLSRLPAPVVV